MFRQKTDAQRTQTQYIRRSDLDQQGAWAWEDTTHAHAGDGWSSHIIVYTSPGTDPNTNRKGAQPR